VRFGPAGIPTVCRTVFEALEYLSSSGLNAMEIEFVHGIRMSEETARSVGKVASDLGISLSVHAPYYVNLASESREKVEASKERIRRSLVLGELLGATVVVVHAGYYGKDRAAASEAIKRGCEEIAEFLEANSMRVKLGLETMGKQSQWGTLEEILPLCRGPCVPVVDFAHIYARNCGRVNYREIMELVQDFKPLHIHFSGIEFVPVGPDKGNERRHLPVSSGGPRFSELVPELARFGSATVISESPLLEKDALLMKREFEKFLNRKG